MPKQRNKPIGEVECFARGCDLKASVFKFRPGGKNPNDWARRWAGKLYATCARGHMCRDQDHILEGATIWPEGGRAEGDEPVKAEPQGELPAQQTPPAAVKLELGGRIPPAQAAAANAGKKVTGGFGFFKFGKGTA